MGWLAAHGNLCALVALAAMTPRTSAGTRAASGGGDTVVVQSGTLAVTIQPSTGKYTVAAGGGTWLTSSASGPSYLGRPAHLTSAPPVTSHGSDIHGAFDQVQLSWSPTPNGGSTGTGSTGSSDAHDAHVLVTSFRAYHGATEMLTMTQKYPAGVPNVTAAYLNHTAAALSGIALGGFPAFNMRASTSKDLNWLAWAGCQIQYTNFGRFSGPMGTFRAGGGQ